MTKTTHKIRPAARIIKTIGQDLIRDMYAAIVELVKNSYDADSENSIVCFSYVSTSKRLIISIKDRGHGMSTDTVLNKWLVPATDDKLLRKRSEGGRILQGRKGIGRFAAAILGERILLETTQDGITTSLILDMDALDYIKFLDQLDLDISVEATGQANGTVIEIEKDNVLENSVREIWTSRQIEKLLVELRSLISPEEVYQSAFQRGFEINFTPFEIKLVFKNFPLEAYSNKEIKIRPFPVLDLYDYRISGTIDEQGRATFKYENQNIPGLPPEENILQVELDPGNSSKYPGQVYIDLRVYDRESESIDNIIKRGLKDPDTQEYVGKQEARKILDEYYGIGIFREQFRIRPYGEQSFDWLDLDKKRVQNPSFKIGHNQIIGFIYVRPEDESGLIEKSARDGLVENKTYFGLKIIVSRFINELEARRFAFREKSLKGGRRTLDDDIDTLFEFGSVTKQIRLELDGLQMQNGQKNTVIEVALVHESSEEVARPPWSSVQSAP